MKIVRPHITLMVLLSVAALCILLSVIFPAQGIQLGGVKLKFVHFDKLFGVDSTQKEHPLDVDERLALLSDTTIVEADTLSLDSLNVRRHQNIGSLQFADGNSDPLFPFFQALDRAKNSGIHIFHYGDSQIESDRMSNILRQKLQSKFGGVGPGLVAAIPITASGNIAQSQSPNWTRHTAYGFDNGKVSHDRYGVMCALGRFTPERDMTTVHSTDSTEAWIELRPSGMSQPLAKQYSEAILYFGNHQYGYVLQVFVDDSLYSQEKIEAGFGMMTRKWDFETTPKTLRFAFKGIDSPDVYGIELQGKTGVSLSNISMRGSDGSALRKINTTEVEKAYSELNAALIILQFGGNNVPYLKDSTQAINTGKSFAHTIRRVQQMAPGIPIIVVGPSDMSTSIDGEYQSYPFLEVMNNSMKQTSLKEGCAYWDMFNIMGGQNSMISWVEHDPPYAGSDYVHFTPLGARKMGELFYKAIDDEYEAWKKAITERYEKERKSSDVVTVPIDG